MCGDTRRILPKTESAIRALTAADVRAAAAPGTQVDAAPTWELLDDMIGRGWPKAWIARELRLGASLQLSRGTVTAANAGKVAALAERLGDRVPPPRRRRQPAPPLDEILATDTRQPAGGGEAAACAARSLFEHGHRLGQAAQRNTLSVEAIAALGATATSRRAS
ncbi:hypothetical protein [Candidatus Mycobacterium methanotrophicum]|uniref:DUF222 domain-containing protein n=1 Tax=Candidatus Mycobacterium methanotrophicum TaxID=2943498 RepID=A0ABY4QR82_9MYCO|nr:hypothetical protein [Candidatus Mycobacterium methanotrophicum]UQX13557.1 hypothetical protein M5I08_25535 [Candidatus Mycobacterium methanotrophicum]